MNPRFAALPPLFFALLALPACTSAPRMPADPHAAQRAYLTVMTISDRSDVAAFVPSQQTVVADAMPAGLEKDAWSLVQPKEAKEPEELEIEPVSSAATGACPEVKDEKAAAQKTGKVDTTKPRHKTKKSISCAHS